MVSPQCIINYTNKTYKSMASYIIYSSTIKTVRFVYLVARLHFPIRLCAFCSLSTVRVVALLSWPCL